MATERCTQRYEPGISGLRGSAAHDVTAASSVLFACFVALVVFSPPLFLIERYNLYAVNKLVVAAIVVALAVMLLRRFAVNVNCGILLLFQVFQVLLLLALAFAHAQFGYAFDAGYVNVAFQIVTCALIFLLLVNGRKVRFFAQFWVGLHLFMAACGVLVFLAGLLAGYGPVAEFSDRPYYDFGLAYTNVYYQLGSVNIIRIAGFYDEPGTFAFYATFALIIAYLYGFPRWQQWLLVVGGLTSLSMAFILVVAMWLLLTVQWRTVLGLGVVVVGAVYAMTALEHEVREQLEAATVDRFARSESDQRILRGDNRTAIMVENFAAFREAPVIGHGLHYESFVGQRYRHGFIANPAAPLATHGLLGAVAYNMHVMVVLLALVFVARLSAREKLVIGAMLLLTLAQRPTTINGLGYLLFILLAYRFAGSEADFRWGKVRISMRRRTSVPPCKVR